ncbi:MAG: hypothetical protein H7296_10015 [Bacteroidia bacterium]|nr:hypothetical protein [Bacteroidia bacterium]
MKVLVTFVMVLTTLILHAQPKQAPKPVTPPPSAAMQRPKTPPPYVLKKDFEEGMESISNQIKSMSANTYNIKSAIDAKQAEINALSGQMSKVEEILNSTAFKISSTNDSLNQTRFSVEEFRKNTEAHVSKHDEALANAMMLIWVLLGLSVLIPLVVFMLMNTKVSKLKSALNKQAYSIDAKISETAENSTAFVKSETSNHRIYTDAELGSIKSDFSSNMKSEMDKMRDELRNMREETNRLNEENKLMSNSSKEMQLELNRLNDKLINPA